MAVDLDPRAQLAIGAEVLGRAVGLTLGPQGRTVALGRKFGPPLATKDGVTVGLAIELPHPLQQAAVALIREAARTTALDTGDGTTTATLLACRMLAEGRRLVEAGYAPVELAGQMATAGGVVADRLAAMAFRATTAALLEAVTTTAANGDRDLGRAVAEVMRKVGHLGVAQVEDSPRRETVGEVHTNEYVVERGPASLYWLDEGDELRLDNPLVVVHQGLVDRELIVAAELALAARRPLVVVAAELGDYGARFLISNHRERVLRSVVVYGPNYGRVREGLLDDLAARVGTHAIRPGVLQLADCRATDLGSCGAVVVSRNRARFIDPPMSGRLAGRIRTLTRELADLEPGAEGADALRTRVGRLAGGSGRILVGGDTLAERAERRARADDAVSAARSALREGLLPGGGVALARVGASLRRGASVGARVVYDACAEPLRAIARNAGADPNVVHARVVGEPLEVWGFDAATGQYRDLVEAGIVDAAASTRSAVATAASVAGLLLTVDAAVVREKR